MKETCNPALVLLSTASTSLLPHPGIHSSSPLPFLPPRCPFNYSQTSNISNYCLNPFYCYSPRHLHLHFSKPISDCASVCDCLVVHVLVFLFIFMCNESCWLFCVLCFVCGCDCCFLSMCWWVYCSYGLIVCVDILLCVGFWCFVHPGFLWLEEGLMKRRGMWKIEMWGELTYFCFNSIKLMAHCSHFWVHIALGSQ